MSRKRGCPLKGQQKRASSLATLCCKRVGIQSDAASFITHIQARLAISQLGEYKLLTGSFYTGIDFVAKQ